MPQLGATAQEENQEQDRKRYPEKPKKNIACRALFVVEFVYFHFVFLWR
jgi:hypothetical protein